MSKRHSNKKNSYTAKPRQHTAAPAQSMEAFTFGEPTAVLDRRDILDYVECVDNGQWYEPPVSFSGLAKSMRAAVHHSSPIYVKRNILVSTYIPHPKLSRQDFSRFVLDFLVFGNAFLEMRRSLSGKAVKFETSPAKYTRRGVEDDAYWYIQSFTQAHQFAPGSVFHLLEPDINQELYGLPEYLSALNSAWLNESATLFRRKYYQNGAHAGYIMYVTDAAQSSTDVEALRKAMRDSKGLGNFKNLFFYAPNGKADGIKIVPLSEVATKDDFFNIKKVSAADMLDAHRIPFQLMGGKPENVGSLGDVEKVAKVFVRNELSPLQSRFMELNEWAGEEVIRFKKYSLEPEDE
ncbi:phage portal protein [Scandinavium sp. TWS1a]|uniref:phage portal protein n=1 Tax=Scandinavium tedordense TaxID=2926521 RepID=UPI0021663EF0|nr:phage portal protein [Scandinavium tedordense]MCS2169083.1 phage portal protein [Scandinavium tedordense]